MGNKGFFSDNNIAILPWPSKSPDVNPIENVWGLLSRRVYAEGKQFESKSELKASILHEWNAIDPEYLQKLVDSMKKRCLRVFKVNGKAIGY